ncbi:MAG: S8 family serine peptidase, partial [Bacteroidota bacterium]
MKLTLLLVFLTVCNVVYGQRTLEERKKALQEIAERTKAEDLERQERVRQYLEEKGLALFETTETSYGAKSTRMLYDIEANGQPVYIATSNRGAAITTGADFLFQSEQSGLALTGDGVKIAVWDGGLVRTSHVEFNEGAIVPRDGASTLNFHATHVTGTIMAKGVNQSARGMAPGVTAVTFDFNNDESEIAGNASPGSTGVLLSNHSYARIGGWDDGRWFGDANISDKEDYDFGFYNSDSRLIDEITYNAPYYLICWAAANDRGDSGDGRFPPDGPYDILPPKGSAKNVLTVGAVRKVAGGYEVPSDVEMSSFSSWGPTDDGRVKPDLVGAGVNILSTFEDFDEHYSSISGTSMATPNVMGTLALLQELNKKVRGNFLKSAALKGLAIHTVHDTGDGKGPDYKFGWGLMNAEDAGKLILKENGTNNIITDVVLQNKENYSLEIQPEEGTEVKVTICWTDLPGTPPAPQLDPTDLMLVNDLDLRVSNGTDTHLPYILDPANPGRIATVGDNFRDNVEKIEFVASGTEPYTITVNHKGELEDGAQEFALIVSYESDERQTFYRIGTGNEWDNPENWSLTSGGEPAMTVPGLDDAVVLDNNSFSQMGSTSTTSELRFALSQNIEVRTIVVTSSEGVVFDLNGNTITTTHGISAAIGDVQFEGEGSIKLVDTEATTNGISGGLESFANVDLIVDYTNGSTAEILSDLHFKSITVENGRLDVTSSTVTLDDFTIKNEAELNVREGNIQILSSFDVSESSTIDFENSGVLFDGETNILGNDTFQPTLIEVTSGTLTVLSDIVTESLTLKLGSNMIQDEGNTITVKDNLSALGREGDRITLSSSTGKANLIVESNLLLCFDFLDVDGVDISGSGAFNVGPNGSIQNANGWQMKECEDVLFADFSIEKVCSGSVMGATDISQGDIASWKWFLDGELVSELPVPALSFPEIKSYEITLEITDIAGDVDEYTATVSAIENTLEDNT